MWVPNLQTSAARSASSRAIAEVKVYGRARDERDGGRCGLDGWARLSATWADGLQRQLVQKRKFPY
mgnify:CR=1 FL=1